MRIIASLVIAFSTYSRIPMPQVEWSDENRKYTLCFFPLIGAVIGLALWGWLWLCDTFSIGSLLRGALGAVIPLLITGGIHMDGFMDTSDALASWQSREKRLEILKDSHTGAFAVIGCVVYLLLAAGILSEAHEANGRLLIGVYVLSRALSAWTLTIFKSARPKGMLDGFRQAAYKRLVTVSSAVYLILCLVFWLLLDIWMAPLCVLAAGAVVIYYCRMAYKQFGGVTGDLAGWFVQMIELVLMLVIVMGGKYI